MFRNYSITLNGYVVEIVYTGIRPNRMMNDNPYWVQTPYITQANCDRNVYVQDPSCVSNSASNTHFTMYSRRKSKCYTCSTEICRNTTVEKSNIWSRKLPTKDEHY